METQSSSMHTPASCKTCEPASHCSSNFVSEVRVVVRVRPFLSQEIAFKNGILRPCTSVIYPCFDSPDAVTVHLKDPDTCRNESYKLDSLFGQEENNVAQIFESEVKPIIPWLLRGRNATVLAYGATGSGKTYTMQGTADSPGLMPLAMSAILSACQATRSRVEVSYFELYMDRCYDLLEVKAREMMVLDDKNGQTHFKGLSQVPITSMHQFEEMFSLGIQRRKTTHTGLNDVSSRSHGILVIHISSPLCDSPDDFACGKLNLVDLAGNEDNRRTCNEGMRFRESAKINQSLFVLSNVIYALNTNNPRVPYRESKLTRILQDSLGGTSRAVMIACLNPGEYQEAVHTVSLAARSRNISKLVSSSSQKMRAANVKVVDMEEKLQAWLESKGKTKSRRIQGANGSMFADISATKLSYNSSVKPKVNNTLVGSNNKERKKCVEFRNLFNDEPFDYFESPCHSFPSNEDDEHTNTTKIDHQSNAFGPEKEEESDCLVDEKNNDKLSSPFREVLSPINANAILMPFEKAESVVHKCNLEPTTPKTPFTASFTNDKLIFSTPLGQFNSMSSNLKHSLMEEYVNFLNTGSRDELLEIKGIGLKMAEYIVELRERSPLKSLGDLVKIGLSSKQVYNLFNKAARGVFDDRNDATANLFGALPAE